MRIYDQDKHLFVERGPDLLRQTLLCRIVNCPFEQFAIIIVGSEAS